MVNRCKFKRHILDNVKVRNKLLLIYIFCVLLPVVLTNVVFLRITGDNIKKQQLDQMNEALLRAKMQLYKQIDDANLAAYNICTDKKINEALGREYTSIVDFYESYDSFLRDSLSKHIYIVNQIGQINIYTNNESIPNSSGYKQIDDEIRNMQWYKIAKENPFKFNLIAYEQKEKRYFSLIKNLNYFGTKQGAEKILKIDFRDALVVKALNSEKTKGDIYLVNDKNQIIYTTNGEYNDSKKEVFPIFDEKAIRGKNQYIIKTPLEHFTEVKSWNLICVVNEKDITDAVHQPKMFIFYMAIVNLLFASIGIYIISYSFSERLKLVCQHVKKVGKQDFQVINCYEGKDEIGEVISEFNRMTIKIQELIRDVYEANLQKKSIEVERKQAEINALQSQINPHFLFNVLETIRMRSVIKKELETAQIIKYVSKMFRRLLEWGDDIITVKQELENIEDFLKVQKYRFGEKLEYVINVDENVSDFKIPKMIFQPLVENACVHGVEEKKNGGTVIVKVKGINNSLECTIKDNGTGIEKNRINEILSGTDRVVNGRRGVGVKNVYNRLKLLYGEDFRFNIESNKEEGTSVIISFPNIYEINDKEE